MGAWGRRSTAKHWGLQCMLAAGIGAQHVACNVVVGLRRGAQLRDGGCTGGKTLQGAGLVGAAQPGLDRAEGGGG